MAIDDAPPPREGSAAAPPPRSDRSGWNWLIAVPLVVSLTVPIFDRSAPALGGVPFFYWYQILAIAVGVLATVAVFRAHERRHARLGDRADADVVAGAADRPAAPSTER